MNNGAPNQTAAEREPFVYIMRSPASCEHDFRGWREFEDGRGGETVCSKCGMGAMEYTLRNDPT